MPFRLPTRVFLYPGARKALDACIPALSAQRVLLVFDAGLAQTPWPTAIERQLIALGCTVETCDEIEPNPRHHTIDAIAQRVRAQGMEAVVGLGGGSVLDAAKAIAMLGNNPGSCLAYEGKNRFENPSLPFIAIPTTCGTGSEVTWVSVITQEAQRRKLSVKGEGMFPTYALVDADVLTTLPAHLVAYTGIDALTHALEAYTCTARNPASDALAEQAIVLLMRYLRRAVADIEGDGEARAKVMEAATLAGMAFGNADVAGVHCLSETLGGLWDLPHGLCNAILLTPVLRYHLPVIEERLAYLYHRVAPEATPAPDIRTDAERLLAALEALVADLRIPPFAALHIDPKSYGEIALGAVANNSNASNPQPMQAKDYQAILMGL